MVFIFSHLAQNVLKMSAKVETVSQRETRAGRRAEKKEEKHVPKGGGRKPKFENENRHHKHGRKRSQSFSAGGNNKFLPPYKKRKKDCLHTQNFAPPTKFLLGGNICDPLNLNSLQDEEINKAMNAVTPKSSPLPTPKRRRPEVEAVVPQFSDDAYLMSGEDEAEYEAQLNISPIKRISRRKKKRPHKKSNSSSSLTALTTNISNGENVSKSDSETISPTATSGPFIVPRPVAQRAETVPKDTPDKEIEAARLVTDDQGANAEKQDSTECCDVASQNVKNKEEVATVKEEITPTPREEFIVPHHPPPRDHLRLSMESQPHDSAEKGWKSDIKDKIVSPVVPQPRITASKFRHMPGIRVEKVAKGQKTPKFNDKNARFHYGNYNRYYGYRNPHFETDPRIKCFTKRRELFFDKDVLDIGCNIGHITLTIARDFGARSIVGLDIDKKLIQVARTNIKHYINCVNSPSNPHFTPERNESIPSESTSAAPVSSTASSTTPLEAGPSTSTAPPELSTKQETTNFFPISMPIIYGPLQVPGTSSSHRKGFPHNVSFVQGNYVLDSDVLVSMEQPQFDVILCLSITKWIQLNWGDAGLKRAFKRMFAQLRPGGVLILEPQSWPSYKKKRNFTETMWKNYKEVKFFPHQYSTYLLSVVGFSKCEVMATPLHQSKGFQRPIKVYTKAITAPLLPPVTSSTGSENSSMQVEEKPGTTENTDKTANAS
ncbi:unnamed protein product [Bemisia tabaci]|uniref:RNA methyltransferase n=1 Tax=Bemisia tabaci TaxID=7038 RepID=A0A9P0CB58_BEMTA|nr:unnamed protein product [Bemisia tabaci]